MILAQQSNSLINQTNHQQYHEYQSIGSDTSPIQPTRSSSSSSTSNSDSSKLNCYQHLQEQNNYSGKSASKRYLNNSSNHNARFHPYQHDNNNNNNNNGNLSNLKQEMINNDSSNSFTNLITSQYQFDFLINNNNANNNSINTNQEQLNDFNNSNQQLQQMSTYNYPNEQYLTSYNMFYPETNSNYNNFHDSNVSNISNNQFYSHSSSNLSISSTKSTLTSLNPSDLYFQLNQQQQQYDYSNNYQQQQQQQQLQAQNDEQNLTLISNVNRKKENELQNDDSKTSYSSLISPCSASSSSSLSTCSVNFKNGKKRSKPANDIRQSRLSAYKTAKKQKQIDDRKFSNGDDDEEFEEDGVEEEEDDEEEDNLNNVNQTIVNENGEFINGIEEPKKRVSANKKERRRTQSINNAFSDLRNRIPQIPTDTKLSKIKTLKLAINYIEHLMKLLQENDPNSLEPFKPDLGKLRRECRSKEIKLEVERKAKGRTGWPSEVWSTELKKKMNDSSSATVTTNTTTTTTSTTSNRIKSNHQTLNTSFNYSNMNQQNQINNFNLIYNTNDYNQYINNSKNKLNFYSNSSSILTNDCENT